MGFQPLQRLSMPNDRGPQLLALLSTFCGLWDIEQLYDYFDSLSKDAIRQEFAERRRDSKPLSSSQHSSIISILSSVSSSSIGSRDGITHASAYHDPSLHVRRNPDQFHLDLCNSFTEPVTSAHPSQYNQDSPYPGFPAPSPTTETDNALHVCIAGRRRYKNKNLLSRHRTEKCESEGIYVCPGCPTNRQQIFKRLDRLRSHFRENHQGVCDEDCNVGDDMPCTTHPSNLDENAAFRPHPQKKAWGCPVCESCFDTCEEWQRHEKTHHKNVVLRDKRDIDVTVEGWSEHNLIKSLLFKSQHLQPATSKYNWNRCHWPLDEEAYASLTFALERHTLPRDVASHRQYAELAIAEALADYALRMGLSGKPHSPPSLEFCRQKAALLLSRPFDPTSGGSLSSSHGRSQADSSQYILVTGRSPDQTYQVHENVAVMKSPASQGMPIQQTRLVLGAGRNAQTDRQPQKSQSSLQDSQRPKSRGFLRDIVSRARSKSNANRVQDTSSLQSVPAMPIATPSQQVQEQEMGEPSSWHDFMAQTPDDAELRPTTRGNPAALLEGNTSNNTSPPRTVQNVREQPEGKRYSEMSFRWTPSDDTENYHPGFDLPGEAHCQIVAESFNSMACWDEDYERFSA